MKTAKIFKHGNSQAVRLPKEFRFDGDEVMIKRASGGILLLPPKIAYDQVVETLGRFKGTFVRSEPKAQKRNWK